METAFINLTYLRNLVRPRTRVRLNSLIPLVASIIFLPGKYKKNSYKRIVCLVCELRAECHSWQHVKPAQGTEKMLPGTPRMATLHTSTNHHTHTHTIVSRVV